MSVLNWVSPALKYFSDSNLMSNYCVFKGKEFFFYYHYKKMFKMRLKPNNFYSFTFTKTWDWKPKWPNLKHNETNMLKT